MSIKFQWQGHEDPETPGGVAAFQVGERTVTVAMPSNTQASALHGLLVHAFAYGRADGMRIDDSQVCNALRSAKQTAMQVAK